MRTRTSSAGVHTFRDVSPRAEIKTATPSLLLRQEMSLLLRHGAGASDLMCSFIHLCDLLILAHAQRNHFVGLNMARETKQRE